MTTTEFTFASTTPMKCANCPRSIKAGDHVTIERHETKYGTSFLHRHTECESAMPTDVKTAPQDLMSALADEAAS